MIFFIVTIISLFTSGITCDSAENSVQEQGESRYCSGRNEYWNEYGCKDNGCENPNAPITCTEYVPNCYCYPGYVRDYNGVCIPKNRCPPKPTCEKENEEWQRCHSGCDGTCDNPNNRLCYGCIDGCFCKDGYVRDNGVCIAYEDCPNKQCGYNEKWYDAHGGCDPTCEAPDRQCRGRIPGCFCLPNYVRSYYGVCIPRYYCDYFYSQRSALPRKVGKTAMRI